jgi:hypothetical protein
MSDRHDHERRLLQLSSLSTDSASPDAMWETYRFDLLLLA